MSIFPLIFYVMDLYGCEQYWVMVMFVFIHVEYLAYSLSVLLFMWFLFVVFFIFIIVTSCVLLGSLDFAPYKNSEAVHSGDCVNTCFTQIRASAYFIGLFYTILYYYITSSNL